MNKNTCEGLQLLFLPFILIMGVFVCLGEEIYWHLKDKRK